MLWVFCKKYLLIALLLYKKSQMILLILLLYKQRTRRKNNLVQYLTFIFSVQNHSYPYLKKSGVLLQYLTQFSITSSILGISIFLCVTLLDSPLQVTTFRLWSKATTTTSSNEILERIPRCMLDS